jgi:hypothetical protein
MQADANQEPLLLEEGSSMGLSRTEHMSSGQRAGGASVAGEDVAGKVLSRLRQA